MANKNVDLDITMDKNDQQSDVFFKMEDSNRNKIQKDVKPDLIVSTDSLPGYGLDLIFDLVKSNGFDGIDLAMWKNFDAWNVDYVKKLSKTYDLPVRVIQVSNNVNEKEMNKALDLCEATGADTICINAPKYFNYKSFNFLVDNLNFYRKNNKHINFSIINPENSSLFALPIPKYRFNNIVEIVKKYSCYIGLDVVNMDTDTFENNFIRKLNDFLPYISTIYFADKNNTGEGHMIPGEGVMKLTTLLKKLKQAGYYRYISTKIEIPKNELADQDKVNLIFKKTRNYFKENLEELKVD